MSVPPRPTPSLALAQAEQVDAICCRFEAAWMAGARPCLDDHLGDTPEPARAALLQELLRVDVYHRRLAGEQPQAQDYLGHFPTLDPAELAQALAPAPSPGSDPYATRVWFNPAAPPSGALGPRPTVPGYEILGVLGRGSMGVVYQARHVALNRLVALKMILAGDHAGEQELARFRTEAEAVAQFQHSHIVQIHEVGEHEGRPYCALEFVDGGSLAHALAGTPLVPTAAARLVEVLARAMHYVHQHGIIHRDLKPANILLQRITTDEHRLTQIVKQENQLNPDSSICVDLCSSVADFSPKITDFGLAKRLAGDAGQTQSGSILGTPSYMAPEQAEGKTREIGSAVDVYALGAILYELLAGRPPFRAATVLDTLEQVRSEEPVPPSRLQPKLPRDLETICLKCLRKEPGKRYPTADALAEDLRRFLAGEPIQARPIGVWERGRKWARRRPMTAALVAVSSLAVVLLVGTLGISNVHIRREQARAEANGKLARDTVAEYFTAVSEDRTLKAHGLELLRRELLTKAKDFYERMAQERSDDPDLEAERGKAFVRLGRIAAETGSDSEAASCFQQAVAIFESLARAPGASEDHQHARTVALHELGNAYQNTGKTALAKETYEKVLPLHERLEGEYPGVSRYQAGRARTLHNLANLYRTTRELVPAKTTYEKTLVLFQQLVDRHPEVPEYQDGLARTLHNLADLYGVTGEGTQRRAAQEKALPLRRDLARKHPDRPDFREELGRLLHDVANLDRDSDRTEQAKKHYEEALGLCQQLADRHPDVVRYQYDLASTYFNLGILYANTRKAAQAKAVFEKALPLIERLVHQQPRVPSYQGLQANLQVCHAGTQVQLGDYAQAIAEVEQVVANPIEDGMVLCNAACVISLCSAAVRHDARRSESDQLRLQEQYAARAVALLRQAIATGFRNVELMRKDADFEPIRARDDFQKILHELVELR